MVAFIVILGIIGLCALFLLGALYLTRVPFWTRLTKQYPLSCAEPMTYGIQDAAVAIYDDTTGYGIKAHIRLAVEAGSLFIAFQPIGFGWQDRLSPLQLPLTGASIEEETLRCGTLRIKLRPGGAIFEWASLVEKTN